MKIKIKFFNMVIHIKFKKTKKLKLLANNLYSKGYYYLFFALFLIMFLYFNITTT